MDCHWVWFCLSVRVSVFLKEYLSLYDLALSILSSCQLIGLALSILPSCQDVASSKGLLMASLQLLLVLPC